ncbi:MAG: hypothetical protein AAF412_09445 [Pseudomonadota bacterium]
MADSYCFAGYPTAVYYDKPGGKAQYELLWGRYIRLTGKEQGKWLEIQRGSDTYWIHKDSTQTEPILKIIFVDIGQGDGCLITTPDNKQIVVDAGAGDNMYRFLRSKFGKFKSAINFDSFVISHPDLDHYGGFRRMFDEPNVKVNTVYHSGIVERVAASPHGLGKRKKVGNRNYVAELIADKPQLDALLTPAKIGTGRKKKAYPSMLRAALDNGRVDDFKMLNADSEYLPGYAKSDDSELYVEVLGPVAEYPDQNSPEKPHLRWLSSKGKTKNGHSVILRMVYDKISIMLGGDLNIPAEEFILEHYTGEDRQPATVEDQERLLRKARKVFQSDFAKCCHHGSADFSELFLKAVNARATIISSGDDEPHAHPRADTLGTIGKHSLGRRPLIFSTELSRSAKEKIKDPHAFRKEIRDAVDRLADAKATGKAGKIKSAQKAYDKVLNKIERSISTYGAINLRTDGKRAVLAYKIEAPRRKDHIWDVYKFEEDDTGELSFLSKH